MINWDELTSVRAVRAALELGQQEMAALLGVSPRTIQSCEQGWRRPSAALEKSLVLLRLANAHGANLGDAVCWRVLECDEEARRGCLVYHCRQGHLCWMLSGNLCRGRPVRSWEQKKAVCGSCNFFAQLTQPTHRGFAAGVGKSSVRGGR